MFGLTLQIAGHRFDQFQLFKAGDIWGPRERITYSAFAITREEYFLCFLFDVLHYIHKL
jgi:hypothetical protein